MIEFPHEQFLEIDILEPNDLLGEVGSMLEAAAGTLGEVEGALGSG